ncbi:MAG: hypothetical protein RLZ62_144 [Bacteroidota bacterium]
MSLLKDIFSRFFIKAEQKPDIAFGRYTDMYKTSGKSAQFERSLRHFDGGELLDSYRSFFAYLTDERFPEHIHIRDEGDILHFEFFQGSCLIRGHADGNGVRAGSRVARAGDLNVGFLRQLMEANHRLSFSRFALDQDNNLCIVFQTAALDASPLKLLHALRELAINADKKDDLLLEEFKSLTPAPDQFRTDITQQEKDIKYEYFRQEAEAALTLLETGKPDPNQYPGLYAYHFLGVAYKLDYLILPEGFILDVLEKIHSAYFNKNQSPSQVRLQQVVKEFRRMLNRSKEEVQAEMYRTRSTFGVTPPLPHGSVAALIEKELPNMEWPLTNGHEKLAEGLPMYIASYLLFHHAPPPPDRALLHLFFRVVENDYFTRLGFGRSYRDSSGRPDRQAVRAEINRIQNTYSSEYPKLKINPDKLDYSSVALFGKTFLQLVMGIDLSQPDR